MDFLCDQREQKTMKKGMQLSARQRLKINLLKGVHAVNKLCLTANNIAPPDYLSTPYGGGSYFETGLHFFTHFLDLCNLKRDSHVLDVGCGIGRMAMPLTAFLNEQGRYQGFDIMPLGIDYCSRHITPSFANFKFQAADIFNAFYNPEGKQSVETFRFPYPDASFDIVFSTSVLTHLAPPAIENYIRETARVLKPGGKCLHTCFMLNVSTLESIRLKRDAPGFRYQMDGFMTSDLNNVEDAIAVPEQVFRRMYREAGFDGLEMYPGSWSGGAGPHLSFQDLCVAGKRKG
jgi:SAM-dependent methyltransferase